MMEILDATHGNKTHSAKLLGITRMTMLNKWYNGSYAIMGMS